MKRALLVAVAAIALGGTPAMAGGSGGGGGSSAPSSSGPSYVPVEEYQSGVEALQAGEYKKAERAFKRVSKVAKKDANTRYMLGLSHLGQEDYKAAAKSFERAVKYDAALYQAHGKLGATRSEEHTSELQSHSDLVCRLLLEKKNAQSKCKILL